MKIAILGVSAANLDAYTITVEGQVRNGRDMLGLMRNASLAFDGTNFTVYLDAPFDIQAATVDGTTPATTVAISPGDMPEIKNIMAATIASFDRGKSYLISNAFVAPTKIIPTIRNYVAVLNTGNDSAVHGASHYLYVAMEDSKPINNTSVTGFTFDVDMNAVKFNAEKKQQQKMNEAQSYLQAYNH